jgi:hypothetical protein
MTHKSGRSVVAGKGREITTQNLHGAIMLLPRMRHVSLGVIFIAGGVVSFI